MFGLVVELGWAVVLCGRVSLFVSERYCDVRCIIMMRVVSSVMYVWADVMRVRCGTGGADSTRLSIKADLLFRLVLIAETITGRQLKPKYQLNEWFSGKFGAARRLVKKPDWLGIAHYGRSLVSSLACRWDDDRARPFPIKISTISFEPGAFHRNPQLFNHSIRIITPEHETRLDFLRVISHSPAF